MVHPCYNSKKEPHVRKQFILRFLFFSALFSPLLWRGAGGEVFAQSNRVWSTYYGGAGGDVVPYITTDMAGNVYLAGSTSSSSGISSGGYQNALGGGGSLDAFLVKFDPNGVRLWATYYGGAGEDIGKCVDTDISGNVYLAGSTSSSSGISSGGFQNTYAGGNSDAFLVKFDSSGTLLWATYYGGTGEDVGNSLAIDDSGNVYMGGQTQSPSGIASGGFQNTYGGSGDAFLVKFSASGTLLWATYYGGAGADEGKGVDTDSSGNVYLAGITNSTSGIASGGFQDTSGSGFVVKLNASGIRLWATYYNGWGNSVATDAWGNVYLAGQTFSKSGIAFGGFQNTFGGGADAFLVKFNETGTRLWATYYGGKVKDYARSVATDAFGNVYLGGDTYSRNGIASGGIQDTHEGVENLFVVMFNSRGNRFCATYFGKDHEEDGRIAADRFGNVYLAGYTPTGLDAGIAGGFQNVFGGLYDVFLVKFTSCDSTLLTTNIMATNIYCNDSCTGTAQAVTTGGTEPYTYAWNPDVAGQSTPTTGSLCPGTYMVTVTDATGSKATAETTILPSTFSLTASSIVPETCLGDSVLLTARGADSYSWSPQSDLNTYTGDSVIAYPDTTTWYTVKGTTVFGCSDSVTVMVNVRPIPTAYPEPNLSLCKGSGITLSVTGGIPGTTYSWYPASGLSDSGIANPAAFPDTTTSYTVVWSNSICAGSATVTVTVNSLPTIVINPDTTIVFGNTTQLEAKGGISYLWNTGETTPVITVKPLQKSVYTVITTDENGCSSVDSVTVFVDESCVDVFVPSVFSPNNDNNNDMLYVNGGCIQHMNFTIYNRWGQKVFNAVNTTTGWDGTYSGKALDTAVFVYYLDATMITGEMITKKGNITLLR